MLHTALLLVPCVQLRTINQGGFTISLWLQENLVWDKQILQLLRDRLTIELIHLRFFFCVMLHGPITRSLIFNLVVLLSRVFHSLIFKRGYMATCQSEWTLNPSPQKTSQICCMRPCGCSILHATVMADPNFLVTLLFFCGGWFTLINPKGYIFLSTVLLTVECFVCTRLLSE